MWRTRIKADPNRPGVCWGMDWCEPEGSRREFLKKMKWIEYPKMLRY
jgi:hypothetical protein